MGKVYKARNLISDRVDAVKVLHPDFVGRADVAERFLREIKLTASLSHAHITLLHTAFRHEGQFVMIMEYVDGVPIENLVRKGPLPAEEAIDYAQQVLAALSYAHAQGIIHRDIKPANIMVTSGGQVKLMDFGIARVIDDPHRTQAGATVGSLYYMSPEQIRADVNIDCRSDLYSLGVTLYQMLTARRPFEGPSNYAIMWAHLSEAPPPPASFVPSMHASLSELVLKAICKDPDGRFQSAEEFRAALLAVARPFDEIPAFLPEAPELASTVTMASPAPDPAPAGLGRTQILRMTAAALLAVALLAAILHFRPTQKKPAAPASAPATAAKSVAAPAGAPATPPAAVPEAKPPAAATATAPKPEAPPRPRRKAATYYEATLTEPVSIRATPQAALKPAADTLRRRVGLRYWLSYRTTASAPFRDVSVDHIFERGDQVKLNIESNIDGFLYVWMKGTSGRETLLFPSPKIDEGRNIVRSWQTTTVPQFGVFVITERPGADVLTLVVSRVPLADLEGRWNDNRLYSSLRERLPSSTRDFEFLSEEDAGSQVQPSRIVVNRNVLLNETVFADVAIRHR